MTEIQIFYDRQGNPISIAEADRLLRDPAYNTVARDEVCGWGVSTVWRAADVDRAMGRPSALFETMVFPPDPETGRLHRELDHACWRYSTEQAALSGHGQALAWVQDELGVAEQDARPGFTCPCCGRATRHPDDIKNGYCGACHWWTGDPELGPPHLAEQCPARAAGADA